jgi:RNA 2',3'-cyclic 3'-phosphodiesterase
VRLFTAIALSDAAREHLSRVREKLVGQRDISGAVSWVRLENLHITLRFFGEVAETALEPFLSALRSVRVDPMELFAQQLVFFPPRRGPVRVIAAGMGGETPRLAELYESIERAATSSGLPREDRRYSPHATIGRWRVRGRGDGGWLRDVKLQEEFPGPTFTANGFVLFESHLDSRGSQYVPLARFGG